MATADVIGPRIGGRMDRLQLGPFHRRLLALIGGGLFLDGFELYLTAGVLGALTKSGWSNMGYNASFVSMTFIGMVVGAWMSGILGDRFGRRFTYQFNLLLFGGASLAAAFAPNIETLIGLRFLMGVGLGAEVVVGYATLTEFVPASHRGRMIGWLAVITNSSLFASTMLGLWIIPNLGWRYMFALVGIGALIVWALRKNLPESPRWLEVQGRHEEAARIVDQMERESGVTPNVRAQLATPAATVTRGTATNAVTVWSLFKPPVLWRTLMGILVNVVIGFCLYGFINWLPTFLVKQGVSIASSLLWLTVMALGAPAGALIGLLLSDRVGRKPVIVGASLWAAAFGSAFAYVGSGGNGVMLMVVGFLLFIGIYVILAVGFALHVPELFRTEYRLRGAAVCSTFGRIATASVQYVVILLFAFGGLTGVVSLLVSLLLLQAVVFAIFGIETARQSLEEIDDARSVSDRDLVTVRAPTHAPL
jgi:MFS transporter, putative metabolite:H+ symporter